MASPSCTWQKLFSIVAIVVDVTSVATTSVVHAANVVATMVIATSVATTNVVVTIVVATFVTSIDYPIFTLQNKHRFKFSYQILNLHSPCDEIIPLVAMTTNCNFCTKKSLVLKLFHPKKRLSQQPCHPQTYTSSLCGKMKQKGTFFTIPMQIFH